VDAGAARSEQPSRGAFRAEIHAGHRPGVAHGRARARYHRRGRGQDRFGQEVREEICGAINGVSETIDQIQPATSGDPSTAQAQIVQSTDQLLASLNAAKAKAAKLSPSDGGKKVTKLFDQYFQSTVDGVTTARQKLAAADPSNVAFAADVAQFSAAMQTLDATTGDPFSKLSSNQDLLQALKKEKSCAEIVTVYGG
jgi:hypothetical protein